MTNEPNLLFKFHQMPPPSLQREDDRDGGEHDDGEDAVAEDGDDDGDGD